LAAVRVVAGLGKAFFTDLTGVLFCGFLLGMGPPGALKGRDLWAKYKPQSTKKAGTKKAGGRILPAVAASRGR
jgi:hypothetical protein